MHHQFFPHCCCIFKMQIKAHCRYQSRNVLLEAGFLPKGDRWWKGALFEKLGRPEDIGSLARFEADSKCIEHSQTTNDGQGNELGSRHNNAFCYWTSLVIYIENKGSCNTITHILYKGPRSIMGFQCTAAASLPHLPSSIADNSSIKLLDPSFDLLFALQGGEIAPIHTSLPFLTINWSRDSLSLQATS